MRSVISFCRLTRHWTLSLLGTDLLLRGMGLGLASRACDPCGHTWCALRGVLSLGSAVTILKFWGMFKQGLCICILPEPRTSYSWFYVGHGCLHMRIPMDHVLWGSWSCSCSWALWGPHSTKQSRHSVRFWIEPKMTKKEMKKNTSIWECPFLKFLDEVFGFWRPFCYLEGSEEDRAPST